MFRADFVPSAYDSVLEKAKGVRTTFRELQVESQKPIAKT
jgi:hypothetical protein